MSDDSYTCRGCKVSESGDVEVWCHCLQRNLRECPCSDCTESHDGSICLKIYDRERFGYQTQKNKY